MRRRFLLFAAVVAVASLIAAAGADAHSDQPAAPAGEPSKEQPSKGLTFDGLEPADSGRCRDGFEIRSEEDRLQGCTHGPDPAPSGIDVREHRSVKELAGDLAGAPGLRARSKAAQVPCEGDGLSGMRVEAIYAHASDKPNRYDQVAPLIQSWAADMDQVFSESALETGGERHVRFVTDSACNLVVRRVQVSPAGDDNFGDTIAELRTQGYDRSSRKYVVWMDANLYCGIGQIMADDRPVQGNYNNGHPAIKGLISRIDTQCWGQLESWGSLEAHELMHNLGGVQRSAPNASSFWHCTDESDTMCYDDDGPGGLGMRQICPQSHEKLFDCNHDDYFNTDPAAGSYLAEHWNAANSSFLTGARNETTPLDTTITAGPSGSTSSSSAAFAFTASEARSRFECRLDGGVWTFCSPPQAYVGLAQGSHTFAVRAIDLMGNADATPATGSWTIEAASCNTSISVSRSAGLRPVVRRGLTVLLSAPGARFVRSELLLSGRMGRRLGLASAGRPHVVVGRGAARLGGGTGKSVVRFTRDAKRRLKQARRAALTLRMIIACSSGGSPQTESRRVLLRR